MPLYTIIRHTNTVTPQIPHSPHGRAPSWWKKRWKAMGQNVLFGAKETCICTYIQKYIQKTYIYIYIYIYISDFCISYIHMYKTYLCHRGVLFLWGGFNTNAKPGRSSERCLDPQAPASPVNILQPLVRWSMWGKRRRLVLLVQVHDCRSYRLCFLAAWGTGTQSKTAQDELCKTTIYIYIYISDNISHL